MKLITLNTHSLAEPDYERKRLAFAQLVKKEVPDILALQEVNQTMSRPVVRVPQELGYVPCGGDEVPVREDNHALALAGILKGLGCRYYWTWASAKVGYGIYEEGLAVFSRSPIEETRQFFISKSHDFHNWKTRKMVGARADGMWFYSVHMGWWDDEEEPFFSHWDRAVEEIRAYSLKDRPVWVMGDFNSPAGIPDGGWAYVKASGWKDTYELAGEKDGGVTVGKVIDGWKERLAGNGGQEGNDGTAGLKGEPPADAEKEIAGNGEARGTAGTAGAEGIAAGQAEVAAETAGAGQAEVAAETAGAGQTAGTAGAAEIAGTGQAAGIAGTAEIAGTGQAAETEETGQTAGTVGAAEIAGTGQAAGVAETAGAAGTGQAEGAAETAGTGQAQGAAEVAEAADTAGTEQAAGAGDSAGTDRMPGMRIDYIWCSQKVHVDKSEVICNGINYEVVSDHYGVMITEKGR